MHSDRVPVTGSRSQIEVLARIEGHRGLAARVVFVPRGNRRVIEQVSVQPMGARLPDTGVTTEALRAVRLGKIQAELAEIIARSERAGVLDQRLAREFRKRPSPGQSPRSDREFAVLAQMYVELLGTAHPVKELARKLGYSEQTVRNMLNEARKRKVLTRPTKRGVAGGELTSTARQLLETQETI
jgi:hypothetical protein